MKHKIIEFNDRHPLLIRKIWLAIALLAVFLPIMAVNPLAALSEPVAGSQIDEVIMSLKPSDEMEIQLSGKNASGTLQTHVVHMTVEEGATPEARLRAFGIIVRYLPQKNGRKVVVKDVIYASEADSAGIYFDDEIISVKPKSRLYFLWAAIPGLVFIVYNIWWWRRRRGRMLE